MFEHMSRALFFKEFKKTHIGVLDISTSAVSGALAMRHEQETAEAYHITKIFKRPVSFAGKHFENERIIPYMLRDGILKIFKDMHSASNHLDIIIINFSDPFFFDLKLDKKTYRQDSKIKISKEEMMLILKNLENEATKYSNSLVVAGYDILGSKINGYDIAFPEGYEGKSLEIAAMFTLLNPTFQKIIEDVKDKFFPRAKIKYISDSRLMWYVSKKTKTIDAATIILSVDGDATGIYLISVDDIQHIGLLPFGLKTLVRRVAAFLKIDIDNAESRIAQYCVDTLEAGLKEKLEKNIKLAMEDWQLEINAVFKNLRESGYPAEILVAGRENSAKIFLSFFRDNFKTNTGLAAEIKYFSAQSLTDFFDTTSSIAQNNAILMASLLYI